MIQRVFRQKPFAKALPIGGIVALMVTGLLWSISSALTGTITANSDVTVGWPACSTTCPSAGSKYTLVDEGATANTSDWVGTGTAGDTGEVLEFGLSTIANVQTVSQVQLCINAQSATNANGSTLDTVALNLRVGGTLQTAVTVTPVFNVWNNHCTTFTGTWTQSQLDGMTAYVTRTKVGSGSPANQDDDIRVSNVYASVTYEPLISYEQSAYRWFNNQDITEPLTFVKTYGGVSQDRGYSVAQTSDGGFVSTGDTFGFGAGNTDLVLSKHDKSGALEWTKTWGGAGGDLGYSVAQASDGGYVVTGQTGSYGAGGIDAVVLKFTSNGTLSWTRTWGGAGSDYGQSLVALADGSIVVTGWTSSSGAGVRDIILLKFDSSGTLSWSKTWGTAGEEYAESLVATSDGGFAISGHTNGTGAGDYDQLLLKFDSTGALSWSRTWGGVGYDDGYSVTQLTDGGLVVVGSTINYGAGADDVAMVKYNSSGTLQWSRTWGGSSNDQPSTVAAAADGGYVVAGQTTSFGAGGEDFFALKFDSNGTLSWNKTWGGTGNEYAFLARQTADNGFAFIGYTTGYGAGNWDAFIAKYDSNGTIDNCSSPMCQTPTATTNSYTVVAGSPATAAATPVLSAASQSVTTPDAAYVSNFIAGKSSDVGSPLSLQNTTATAPSGDALIRLRMNVHVGISEAAAGIEAFKLQYVGKGTGTCAAPSGGTPSAYADVTTATHIAYANNPLTGDATPISSNANDPTHGSDTIVRQTYEESNNLAIRNAIPAGQDGQWDFALRVDATAPDNTNYCFRIVKSGGSVINSYTAYPEIITPTKTVTQSSYRFYQNADSINPGAPLVAQDTATSVASEIPLRLRQRLAVDGRQLTASAGSYKLQYAEKSGTCSASFGGTIYDVNSQLGMQSQTKFAGTAIDDGGLNNVTWGTPQNVTLQDAQTANAYNSLSPRLSNFLRTSSHGFTIPANATISGIILNAGGLSSGGSDDAYIALFSNFGESADRSQNLVWDGERQWGGTTDLWGLSNWTPAMVNDSSFGGKLQALVALDDSAVIDYVSLSVYYTVPQTNGPVSFYDNASVASGSTIASSNDPTGRTTAYQTYNETDPYSNNIAAVPAGNDGLWDLSLTTSAAAAGKTYCFRTVQANGTPLNTYSQFPELMVTAPSGGPTLDQQMRGGASVRNGNKSPLTF